MVIDYEKDVLFKLQCAEYHYNNCLGATVSVDFNSLNEKLIAVSSEFTAMMLTYQSSLDILAQLINEKRNLGLKENRLYFSDVYTVISNPDKVLSDIAEDIVQIHNNSIYLRAYCNTSKHRNLIYISNNRLLYKQEHSVEYLTIDSFFRNSTEYPSRLLQTFLLDFRNHLPKLIPAVIAKVT